MTVLRLTIAILFLLIAAPASGQTTQGPLAELAWLVGGTWVAETELPGGEHERTEVIYQWTDTGNALRYSLCRTRGEVTTPALDGIGGFHPGVKQIVLWEIDDQGKVTESIAVPHARGLTLQELLYQKEGGAMPVRAEITRGEDGESFVFSASVPRGEGWKEVFVREYRRVRHELAGMD